MYNKQRINIANKCSNKHKPLQHSAQINRVLSKYEILCINLNTLLLQNIDLNNSSITTVQSCYTAKKRKRKMKKIPPSASYWQYTQHLFPVTLHSSLTTQKKKPRMLCCSHMSAPMTITRLLIQSFFTHYFSE